MSDESAIEAEIEGMKKGLAKCLVCGAEAEIVRFGIEKEGVWVGCCQSVECSRYIEYHARGWSVRDTVRDWNRRNLGLFGMIRRAKMWYRNRFGEGAAEKKRVIAEKKAKREKKDREMEEKIGINIGNGGKIK